MIPVAILIVIVGGVELWLHLSARWQIHSLKRRLERAEQGLRDANLLSDGY